MSGYAVRVAAGQAAPPVRVFRPGVPEGPLGVGAQGDWAVRAQGVLPVHAYLFFDGETLFVASADRGSPAEIAGAPLALEWTSVEPGEEISFGGARLEVRLAGVPAARRAPVPEPRSPVAPAVPAPRFGAPPAAAPVVMPAVPGAGPRSMDELEKEDETRVLPIEQMMRQQRAASVPELPSAPPTPVVSFGRPPPRGAPSAAPSSPGAPAGFDPPPMPAGFDPPPMPAGFDPPPMPAGFDPPPRSAGFEAARPAAVAASQKGGGGGAFVRAIREASPVRKALYVLMPLSLAAFAYVVLFDDAPSTKPGHRPAASASAARPRASATASASAAPVLSAAAVATPAEVATGVLSPPPPVSSAVAKGERTAERRAVDAVAAGNFADALELYKALAGAHPQVPAYAEAVRILQDRLAVPR